MQQSEKIGAADREGDEHHPGDDNGLDSQSAAHCPASAARQYPENSRGFERADRNQEHDDCRSRKFKVAPHYHARRAAEDTAGSESDTCPQS